MFLLLIGCFMSSMLTATTPESIIKTHLPHEELCSITPLAGGLSNDKLFLCRTVTNTYVLKLFQPDSPYAKHEIPTHVAAAQKNLAPAIYASGDNFLLMAFINGPTFRLKERNNKSFLKSLAKTVSIIEPMHELAQQRQLNVIQETYDCFYALDKTTPHYNLLQEGKKVVEHIEHFLQTSNRQFVFCHGDMQPRNFFFNNNNVVLIDWSDGGMYYQWYDLTRASIMCCLSPKSDEYLLAYYLGHSPTTADLQYFKNLKCLHRYYDAIRLLQYLVTQKPLTPCALPINSFEQLQIEWAKHDGADYPSDLQELAYAQLQAFLQEAHAIGLTTISN
jgi:thiamine kinase-like enzyme